MGDIITFSPRDPKTGLPLNDPKTGLPVNPTFVGKGSKIEHPDLLPIFRGAYWPGSGDLTVTSIMNGIYSIVGGPYLQGLWRYGYAGPVNVRDAMVDTSPLDIPLPAPAPGVSQTQEVSNRVHDYIEWLVTNDKIDNVDDNHDLIVMVFLDPAVPSPIDTDMAGKQGGVVGFNSSIDDTNFADDATRFEWGWVTTSSRILATVTAIFSHELVESITDPFGTGWERTYPAPDPGEGQIGDVCSQFGIVNGTGVSAYWAEAVKVCVIPTAGTRRLSLSYTQDKHEPVDGQPREGYVNLPAMCGGGQYFSYVERTYQNNFTIHADLSGYESPVVSYAINGHEVPVGEDTIEVEATWDVPRSNPLFPDLSFYLKPNTALLTTWKPSAMSSYITISVGPHAGNTYLTITVSAWERFDNDTVGGLGSTRRTAVLDIGGYVGDLKNQEIIWRPEHDAALKNCSRLTHLANGLELVLGAPQPGDPENLRDIIYNALTDETPDRAENLRGAAHLLESSRPEVANALKSLAARAIPGG